MSTTAVEVYYPDTDGQPMADNTIQWDWMVMIVGELRQQFAGQTVFVAGNLFWYPVQGRPDVVAAPDALVAFGRPPGDRRSYQQWKEGNVPPQVVFEVLSLSNSDDEMADKLEFYERHGADEYFVIDPYTHSYEAYARRRNRLRPVPTSKLNGYLSPALGVRFVVGDGVLSLHGPDGRPFQHRAEREADLLAELARNAAVIDAERARADAERSRADAERARADAERARADAERARADAERAAKERLAAVLRELGVDPDRA
jgi:hypothetical protein